VPIGSKLKASPFSSNAFLLTMLALSTEAAEPLNSGSGRLSLTTKA
jgi:hypothetical protein